MIGAGVAGLAAALGAAEDGQRACCSWTRTRSPVRASRPARPATRDRPPARRSSTAHAGVERLADAACIGLYEGPLAVVVAPDLVHHVHPQAIVVACGGMEAHQVFQGNDLPGVFLARGAARLAGVHGVQAGRARRGLGAAARGRSCTPARCADAGVEIAAVVAAAGVDASATGFRVGGRRGRRGHRQASASRASWSARRAAAARPSRATCCAVGAAIQPNDHLPRLAYDLPVVLAGEAALTEPGARSTTRRARGRRAGIARGQRAAAVRARRRTRRRSAAARAATSASARTFDVKDVEVAIARGLRLRRAAQALHDRHHGPVPGAPVRTSQLRTIAERVTPDEADRVGQPTTLRPPVRPAAARGGRAPAPATTSSGTRRCTRSTSTPGATTMWAGPWKRIEAYCGDVDGEYWAVRQRVGMIDVGTLGKFLVAGPDVVEFLERIYPMRVGRPRAGAPALRAAARGGRRDHRRRHGLRARGRRFYLTVTTSGAERLESWMLDWRDAWGLDVFVVNQTSSLGAVNVAGPARARAPGRSSPTTRSTRRASRTCATAGSRSPACPAWPCGSASWASSATSCTSPPRAPRSSGTRIMDAGREWDIRAVRPAGAAPAAAGEGAHHRLAGHRLRDDALEGRHGLGGQARQARLRRQGGAPARPKQRTPRELLVPWQMAPGTAAPPEGATVKVGGQLAGRVTSSLVLAGARPPAGPGLGDAASTPHEGAAVLIDNAPATDAPATPCTTRRE